MTDVTDEERLAVARDVIPLVLDPVPPDQQMSVVNDLCTPGANWDEKTEGPDLGAYIFTQLIDAIVRARRPSA